MVKQKPGIIPRNFVVLYHGSCRSIITRNAWYNPVQFVHSPTPQL